MNPPSPLHQLVERNLSRRLEAALPAEHAVLTEVGWRFYLRQRSETQSDRCDIRTVMGRTHESSSINAHRDLLL
jgi:hypothetical protein